MIKINTTKAGQVDITHIQIQCLKSTLNHEDTSHVSSHGTSVKHFPKLHLDKE
jgi:hypothetical protein